MDLVILAVSCPLEILTIFGLMKYVELYFMICKDLSMSILDHCLSIQENMGKEV